MKSVNTDIAYDYIRKRILDGVYPPGHPLLTELLSEEIKVSRTPVRDALRKLEMDGLVTIQAHLGAGVKKMDLKEFRETCELRLALESHTAGLAAKNRTEADLHELRFLLESMQRMAERIKTAEEDQALVQELVQTDVRFHVAILTAAKNDVIKKEILRLHLINRVVMSGISTLRRLTPKNDQLVRNSIALATHGEIYDKIARSDVLGAKRAMESHLEEMIESSMRVLTRAESGLIARELTPAELAYTSSLLERPA